MDEMTFTNDDVGKRVVDATGDEVGVVADVRKGVPYVDPNPDTFDKIKAKLGWESGEDTYPLESAQVAELTDDEIRLR